MSVNFLIFNSLWIFQILSSFFLLCIFFNKLDVLLNKAYAVKDVEKYNEQIKKISSFNILFYTPFPYISGKKKIIPYIKIPQELQEDYLEVVHFEKLGEKDGIFPIFHAAGFTVVEGALKTRVFGVAAGLYHFGYCSTSPPRSVQAMNSRPLSVQ